MPSGINTSGICSFIYRHRSYLSLLGVTPRISQDERSSVITHESTPSVSMMMALAHRSSVKRTSCKSEREGGEQGQVNLGDGGTRDYPAAPTRFRVTRRGGWGREEQKRRKSVRFHWPCCCSSRRGDASVCPRRRCCLRAAGLMCPSRGSFSGWGSRRSALGKKKTCHLDFFSFVFSLL